MLTSVLVLRRQDDGGWGLGVRCDPEYEEEHAEGVEDYKKTSVDPKDALGGGALSFFTVKVAAMRLVRGLDTGGRPAVAVFLACLKVVAGASKPEQVMS